MPGALGAVGRVGFILLGWGFPSPGWLSGEGSAGGREEGPSWPGSFQAPSGCRRPAPGSPTVTKGSSRGGDTSSLQCGEAPDPGCS